MDTLMLLATEPTGFWQSIISWFGSFIGNYGWTIVIFTIVLKLILSPLDFYQKFGMRKTQRNQALLKPELDRINEKYGNNKQLVQQKTMELYKRNNISPASGCLPILVYFVVTLLVFFTFFGAMNNVSQIKIANEYENLQNVYVENYYNFKSDFLAGNSTVSLDGVEYNYSALSSYAEEKSADYLSEGKYVVGETIYQTQQEFVDAFVDTTLQTVAQDKVLENFTENKVSFLWIKNVFRPDNYSASFPSYTEFVKTVNNLYAEKEDDLGNKYYYKSIDNTVGENGYFYLTDDAESNVEILAQAKLQGEKDFNVVTMSVRTQYSSWNGYFILVLLAAVSTLLGQLLANAGAKAKTKKGEEVKIAQPTNKVMMIVMPLIMVWFTWGYPSVFALYIVTNGFVSILINYLINLILNKIDSKREEKQLVKISLKDRNEARVNKQIVGGEVANQDYRIQKKGKILEEKAQKSPKKQKNVEKTKEENNQGENE